MSTRIEDNRTLGELIKGASNDLSLLVRKEVELAKLEIRSEVNHAADAGKAFGAAAVAGYLAMVLLAFAAAWGLAELVPAGVAFLIVGLLFGVGAGLGFVAGRTKISQLHPVPEQTVETIKEDVQWLKTHKS